MAQGSRGNYLRPWPRLARAVPHICSTLSFTRQPVRSRIKWAIFLQLAVRNASEIRQEPVRRRPRAVGLNSASQERVLTYMRRFLCYTALLLMLALLAGCATESDSPTIYVGMSRDRLRARFGEPLRVERTRTGGEDWYYPFSSWRNSNFEGNVENDGETRSASVSMTLSDGNNTRECPIHLSPDGYVVEPLPVGKVVGR
jgi:outer membrane protein assembly factor BamE (lipoprotein component of BamABCDE complex)